MTELNDIIERHLAYQDAPTLTDENKTAILNETLTLDSARKYAGVLASFEEGGKFEEVLALAHRLRDDCIDYLDQLGINPSPYTESITWPIWDIAKQHYMFQNQSESDRGRYHLENPLTDQRVQTDIVDRHLGWELYGIIVQDPSFVDSIDLDPKIEILGLVGKGPKENGTLASSDLTTLGRLIRTNYDLK